MIVVRGYNVTSPLGATAAENLCAVRRGLSSLRPCHHLWGLHDDFVASLFTPEQREAMALPGFSRFEQLAICSARKAIRQAQADVSGPSSLFILSSTKGDIEHLTLSAHPSDAPSLPRSALRIARYLGFSTQPVVVDNACISGLSALLLAQRLLSMGLYRQIVVCGCEVQSPFIVSGFQSLRALSASPCRPFDMERKGLNLGEAASTVVLSASSAHPSSQGWMLKAGAMRNDAFHLSAPSRSAEGALRALEAVMKQQDADELACVNAHGTATLFNDQMESVAIERAGLGAVPVNALKGNYGHTMGACGVLETVLTMCALNEGLVLPTKGYAERGVSGKIRVAQAEETTKKRSFIKMLSGFGGCNAALLMEYGACAGPAKGQVEPSDYRVTHDVTLSPDSVTVDGSPLQHDDTGKQLITELYKKYVGNYPKFYKMDLLCRLGFVASELLLQAERQDARPQDASRAVVLMGNHGSYCADKAYLETLSGDEGCYPSPERFIYTLPNIVTGEIAIRNHYHGETTFYLLPERDKESEKRLIRASFLDPVTTSVIGGWVDCTADDAFEAHLMLFEKNKK